jgi:OFA family oxalate/formate antiporter-like MFS transporter
MSTQNLGAPRPRSRAAWTFTTQSLVAIVMRPCMCDGRVQSPIHLDLADASADRAAGRVTAESAVTFSILIVCQTFLSPLEGYLMTNRNPRPMGVVIA